jgi:hypothetical protein
VEGIIDDNGVSHTFHTGHDAPAGAVIRHDATVSAPGASAGVPVFALGDILLDNADGVGRAGDVLRRSSVAWGLRFVDPDTGEERGDPHRAGRDRSIRTQPGRFLTEPEAAELFPEGLAQTMGDLREGDVITAHQVDRKQGRKDHATVTDVGHGTMMDVYYRFDDGQKGKARRRQDQPVTVHARKYAALTLLEAARLQTPDVRQIKVEELPALQEDTWIHVFASRGNHNSREKTQSVLARIITAELRPSRERHMPASVVMTLESPDGTRAVWTAAGTLRGVLVWDGDLPENPLFLSGIDTASLPVPTAPAPAAPADRQPAAEPGREYTDTEGRAAALPDKVQPAPPSKDDGPKGQPVLSHGAERTSVRNTTRDDNTLTGLLKASDFRWSSRQGLWYLNSTWKPATRDAKVSQFLRAAHAAGITIAHEDPDGGRRVALIRPGTWVRIDPDAGEAIVVPSARSGTEAVSHPALYAVFLDRAGADIRVRTRLGDHDHTLLIRTTAGILPCAKEAEASAWLRDNAPGLTAESARLDLEAGRDVSEVQPGQDVIIEVRPLTLATVKGIGSHRPTRGAVLANVQGGSTHERYVLLENQGRRAWFSAPAAQRADIVGGEPQPGAKYAPPQFQIQPAAEIAIGTPVTVEGINATGGPVGIIELTKATGALTGLAHGPDGRETATIATSDGSSVQIASHHGPLEAYTFTPGSLEPLDSGQPQDLAAAPAPQLNREAGPEL